MGNNNLLLTLITEVLGKPKKSNKHRGQYAYDCPVCSAEKGLPNGDGKGKFEVNVKRGVYKCWVCHDTNQTHGSIKKLFRSFGGPGIWAKVKKLGIDLSKDTKRIKPEEVGEVHLPKGFVRFEDANSNSLVWKQGWNYLTKKRKLTEETIFKHNMGFTTEDKEYENRIIIPSYDKDGELNYFTARSWLSYTKMRYKNPDIPRETIIFNENMINWDGTIYLVEGPLDHVVVHNSIPLLGKDIHDKLISTIMEKATGYIVILLDGEDKVWNTVKKIYSKLNVSKLYNKIKVIKLNNNMDIGEVNEKFGRKGVVEVMRSSYRLKESSL